jgi:hypothetical protein
MGLIHAMQSNGPLHQVEKGFLSYSTPIFYLVTCHHHLMILLLLQMLPHQSTTPVYTGFGLSHNASPVQFQPRSRLGWAQTCWPWVGFGPSPAFH